MTLFLHAFSFRWERMTGIELEDSKSFGVFLLAGMFTATTKTFNRCNKGPFTYYVVGLGGGGGQTKYFKILRGEGGGPGI